METIVCIMTSFIIGFVLTNYYQDDQIKKDETGGQGKTHGQIRKDLFWRPSYRWEDNIQMGFY